MTIETQVILEPSLAVFVAKIVELTKEGWDINPEITPSQFGWQYEVGMIRSAEQDTGDETKKAGRPRKRGF